jgi:hypothetical protein
MQPFAGAAARLPGPFVTASRVAVSEPAQRPLREQERPIGLGHCFRYDLRRPARKGDHAAAAPELPEPIVDLSCRDL